VAGAAGALPLWARSHWDRSRISAITDEIGKSADDAVDFLHELALQCVEIRNVPGTNKEYPATREPEMQADGAHLVNEGVKVSCLDSSLLRFAWPDTEGADAARWERRMDDLRKALRCAQIMGADKIRIFAGLRSTDPGAMLPRTAAAIGEMAGEAEKQKVTLLLENDPATNVATCAELAAAMKLLPQKSVAISWNPHISAKLERPFPGGYGLLPKKRLLNVRVQAASLRPGAEMEDWKAILVALDKDGYSGKLGLETGATGGTRFASARDSVDQLQHIVREVS
jgi:sugar phosphate isomerase/epimerase